MRPLLLLPLLPLLLSLSSVSISACDTETPTQALIDNAYPPPPDGSAGPAPAMVVYRAWWVTTYFPAPVAPASSSGELRSVPATDFAYAVLAPGWDPSSATRPTTFVLLKSKQRLSAARGETLHIVVSDATFAGSCDAHQPLPRGDADFIAASIFPAELSGFTYDAATCTMTATPDGGADAAADAADADDAADAAEGG
jgi:hypothetical protein